MYNLKLEEFLSKVVIPSTPNDQQDSCWFELVDWVMNNYQGVPSAELQRLIDREIPVWLQSFDNASALAESLFEMSCRQALWAGAIAARYAVENVWELYSENKAPLEAVQTIEFHLKNTDSHVFDKSLLQAGGGAWSAVNFSGLRRNYLQNMYNSAMVPYHVSYAAYWENDSTECRQAIFGIERAVAATSDKEICQVIVEKMPKFCFEDLLRWEYFKGKRFTF